MSLTYDHIFTFLVNYLLKNLDDDNENGDYKGMTLIFAMALVLTNIFSKEFHQFLIYALFCKSKQNLITVKKLIRSKTQENVSLSILYSCNFKFALFGFFKSFRNFSETITLIIIPFVNFFAVQTEASNEMVNDVFNNRKRKNKNQNGNKHLFCRLILFSLFLVLKIILFLFKNDSQVLYWKTRFPMRIKPKFLSSDSVIRFIIVSRRFCQHTNVLSHYAKIVKQRLKTNNKKHMGLRKELEVPCIGLTRILLPMR